MGVLGRMGILDEIRQMQTGMGEQIVVDDNGRKLASLPAHFMSGDVEILRGDLSRILYERTRETTEYKFGNSIASITETTDGVDVTFERGAPRTFDLVVGADGLHSNVRRLAFGDESQFIRYLGYYVAGFEVPNHLNLDHTGLLHNVPGKLVDISSSRNSSQASTMFVFASEPLDYDRRDVWRQKKILADICHRHPRLHRAPALLARARRDIAGRARQGSSHPPLALRGRECAGRFLRGARARLRVPDLR
jgi:2-polyprenyl-6-methoxyphenol hydroxylase-like FAD-dependent oxidoreductase